MKVPDVVHNFNAVLDADQAARDELGIGDDIVALATLVENKRFVRDILRAYHQEQQAQSKLPRAELRAALHRAFAAVEDDDLDALSAALLECADLIGRPR
jgi:hypothetical protein